MPGIFIRASSTVTVLAATMAICGCASRPPADPSAAFADPQLHAYVDAMRTDLKRGKVDTINGVMKLSAAEAAKFWPIYQDYEEEYFAIGDRRVVLLNTYLKLNSAGKVDDRAAGEIAYGLIACEADRIELYKKYFGEIEKELSALRAVQFLQIEHRIQTIIDLLVARELPMASSFPAADTH